MIGWLEEVAEIRNRKVSDADGCYSGVGSKSRSERVKVPMEYASTDNGDGVQMGINNQPRMQFSFYRDILVRSLQWHNIKSPAQTPFQ